MNPSLIYVADPQCGWCYGNSNNILFVKEKLAEKYDFEYWVGGLWLPPQAPAGGIELADFIRQNGPRMSEYTGMQIGRGYYELCNNPDYIFSSFEPCAAIVWCKHNAPESVFEFAKLVQESLFLHGNRLDELAHYESIFETLDLDWEQFKEEWLEDENAEATEEEFKASKLLAQGYPALILKTHEGYQTIANGYFTPKQIEDALEGL